MYEPELTLEQIETWIRKFRFDAEFRKAHSCVPIRCLCDWAGVSRPALYRILRGDLGMTKNYRARLTVAIRAVEQGLRWKRLPNNTFCVIDEARWNRLPRYERPRKPVERMTA